MRAWLIVPVAALLLAGCGAPLHTSGGPIGPTVQTRKPAPPAAAQEPNPANGFEPGQILVKPKPGETADDLKRRFGAENVTPYRPDGMDENLAIELGMDQWFIIKVPEGTELGTMGGLIENGDVVDTRLAPRGQKPI